ncbi:MAG TPA: aldo/keto reductase [Chitinophagaceae bacterium]|nr:aldo/keto reductase [Chitinophagaceae bacterium]
MSTTEIKYPAEAGNDLQSSTFLLSGERRINRLGYGTMQLTGPGVWGDAPNRELAKTILKTAVESGVNFIDTADAYGPHTSEILIHDAIKGYYSKILIATKGGFERTGPGQWVTNGKPEYIRKAIEGSLKRLGISQIELWQLHRIDPKVPVEETLGPVAEAVAAGKIKYVGLSEVDIKGIEKARKVLPIVSVQNLYNLGNRQWEDVVDYTSKENIAFIPWYPLASGPGKLKEIIGKIAAKYNATTAQIAIAWLLKRSQNVLLIPGTGSLEHLKENMESAKIKLSDEDFHNLSN